MNGTRLIAAALALVTAACAGGTPTTIVRVDIPATRSHTEVWTALTDALLAADYRVAEKDAARRVLVTEWQVALSPVAGDGRRRRIRASMDARPDGSTIELIVGEEINTNRTEPMLEAGAIWEPVTPSPAAVAEIRVLIFDRLKINSDDGEPDDPRIRATAEPGNPQPTPAVLPRAW